MGYIYKITNKVNNKMYIGQTVKTVNKRFTQHINNSNKPYFSQIVLYKAFNKYGIENFICETIEEVPNELLDEREQYWIEYYDTYFNGYNSTLGGRATELYNWDVDDIIEKYLELKSARKVAETIGCDHSSVDKILNANNIKRFSAAQQQSQPVIFINKEQILRFETTTEAAEYFINNKISKRTDIKSLRQDIVSRIHSGKTLFGFKVYYESKRQSTPQVTED